MAIETVRFTVQLSSDIGERCKHCEQSVGGGWDDDKSLAGSINHYIAEHGYRLLHVGTQTTHGQDGKPWHTTVAVLGHDDPPPIMPLPEVTIGWADEEEQQP